MIGNMNSLPASEPVVIGLGSNLGNRLQNLSTAIDLINSNAGPVLFMSSVYETAAWGNEAMPPYLNQVLITGTIMDPITLLEALLEIENKMGRERNTKWTSRIIDLDILFYGEKIINKSKLKIPHPHLHERKFTLVPLVEIIPEFIHPVFKKSMRQLSVICHDTLSVNKAGASLTF